MSFQLNGQVIRPGKSFVDADGNQYPTNWVTVLSQETKDALGIVWIPDSAPVDTRFYWSEGNPKRLEDEPAVNEDGDAVFDKNGVQFINCGLKTDWIKQQKETAGSLLSITDWYVTRKAEAGTEIPANVATYRTAVRTVSGQREAQIAAVTTVDELKALLESQPKVYDPDTDTMVDNPETFITPWPEE